ncbi:MAG: phosphate ABC transporter ATP-binding protein [Oscillatoriales cyanobacterium SM2_1_8]|nr:phosphate ABC transporter ATP-binding protein [Oscillatoriales cyanobacterium SM2_1_8]
MTAALPPVAIAENLRVSYGKTVAVTDVSLAAIPGEILAFVGPSGCGKSTVLRCFNRLNDLVAQARVEGQVYLHGVPIYAPEVDPVAVRQQVGMVFQRPNPFPKSIFDNVAFGLRLGRPLPKSELSQRVEQALRQAALWEEVKDKLHQSALTLSGGQQQRLCLARAIAVQPQLLLLDEPCSALDPLSTERIEHLLRELKPALAIVLVTHNLAQAVRVADKTAFFNVEAGCGRLVEWGPTATLFAQPVHPATAAYTRGQFG